MYVREADAQVYVIVNAGHCPNINDVPVNITPHYTSTVKSHTVLLTTMNAFSNYVRNASPFASLRPRQHSQQSAYFSVTLPARKGLLRPHVQRRT